MKLKLPRRLNAVADLGPYEVHVGALTERHVGLTVVVRKALPDGRCNVLIGPLRHVPLESQIKPLLVLQAGDYSTGMHPSAKVMVVPDDYKATVTVAPKVAP